MMQVDTAINILEQVHDGKTHIGEYFSKIFEDLPVSVAWMHLDDKKKAIIWDGCNQFGTKIVGFRDQEKIIGRTDFEINLKEEYAKQCLADALYVVEQKQAILKIERPLLRRDGQQALLSISKAPLYDQAKNVNGLSCIFTDTSVLKESTLACYNEISNYRLVDIYHSFRNKQNYFVDIDGQIIRLTARQAECLTHLSMGKMIKQISNTLNCSSRTIEDHINLLKRKLGVYSTAELIDCFWRNPIKWF